MARDIPNRPRAFTGGLRALGLMIALMWGVEILDALDNHGLDGDGITPRTLPGLLGILLAPFLHASFGHLIANTVPLALMGIPIALGGLARLLEVTTIVALASGLGVWLVASGSTTTIGASGLVFGYAGYLVGRGFLHGHLGSVALGALVVVAFGGALLSGLVPHAGVSWQAHLFGGLGGVIAAARARETRGRPAARQRTASS